MQVNNLFSPQNAGLAAYKAVDETTCSLTEDEIKKVLQDALNKKIAATNNRNYSIAVNTEPVYTIPNYEDLYKAIVSDLQVIHGWEIDEYNQPQIIQLAAYFSNDERFEGDLNKGLLLVGNVGCGKTTLLKTLRKNTKAPYAIYSCREVADDFAQYGHSALKRFIKLREVNRREYSGHSLIGYCFDDLGTETVKKNFGNEVNAMTEVILNLYDSGETKGRIHLTTNISGEDIKSYYGQRAASRLREMVNIIEFDINATDRRK